LSTDSNSRVTRLARLVPIFDHGPGLA
jgi:hypothetical protein